MSHGKDRTETVPFGAFATSLLPCLIFGFLLTLLTRPVDALAAKRPNFVVIQTDDQTLASVRALYRSENGAIRAVMPNTGRLLRRGGFEFARAHTASPLCAPSRASLLTGQYPHNNGLLKNDGPTGGWNGWQRLPIREQNLAVALDRSGYRTIHIGKFLNSYRGRKGKGIETRRPPGWDRWTALTDRYSMGRDRTPFYRYVLNDQGRRTGPFGTRGAERSGCVFDLFSRPSGEPACAHFTDRTTLIATRELKLARRAGRPFLMAVSYTAPHGKTVGNGEAADPRGGPEPSARHRGSASGTRLPRPASFNEPDVSDKPAFIRKASKRLRRGQIRGMAGHYRAYLESLRGVDDGIGTLFAGLRRSGELDDTYIFFTSDNGLFFGEHRFEPSKFLPYEPVVRVPLLVRGPGVPAGERSRAPVSLIDVAPTIAGLAGVTLNYEVDGTSLRPFWRDPGRIGNRPILFEVGNLPEEGETSLRRRAPFRASAGIRVGRWKYIRYRGGEFELYDVRNDPEELRNLAINPRYSEVTEGLQQALRQYEDCAGDECLQEIPIPPLPPLPPLPPFP